MNVRGTKKYSYPLWPLFLFPFAVFVVKNQALGNFINTLLPVAFAVYLLLVKILYYIFNNY